MKKFFLLLIIPVWSIAQTATKQTSPAPTTVEEYNYITKGYKIQVESGLDMKKGYVLIDDSTYEEYGRTVTFKFLKRINDNAPCAVMIIYKGGAYGDKYLCIPTPGAKEIWKQAQEDFNATFNGSSSYVATEAMTWALMKLASRKM